MINVNKVTVVVVVIMIIVVQVICSHSLAVLGQVLFYRCAVGYLFVH